MRMLIILLVFTLALVVSIGPSRARDMLTTNGKDVPTLAYCDLLSNTREYDNKQVRVKAVLRVGYEWEEIYCLNCFDVNQRTWVKFGDELDACTKRAVRKLISSREGTFTIVVVGEFQSSQGHYGHLGAYRYQFVIKCIEKAKRLLKDGRSPSLLSKNAFKDAC